MSDNERADATYIEKNKQYICNTNQDKLLADLQQKVNELKADNERLLDFIDTVRQCAGQMWLAKDAEKEWLQTKQQSLAEIKAQAIEEAVYSYLKAATKTELSCTDYLNKFATKLREQAK